jgi:uncharacterized protein YndB with AHSA1/START domain
MRIRRRFSLYESSSIPPTRNVIDTPKIRMSPKPIVEKSVEIATSSNRVWRALMDPEMIVQWMGGAHVDSTWELGSEITFTGTMPNFNKKYRDRGTVLAVQPEKFLQYSHWSQMTRLPDIPENRTILTFLLEPIDEKTRLTIRQENFHSDVEYKHANFFWGVALYIMKNMLEQ